MQNKHKNVIIMNILVDSSLDIRPNVISTTYDIHSINVNWIEGKINRASFQSFRNRNHCKNVLICKPSHYLMLKIHIFKLKVIL